MVKEGVSILEELCGQLPDFATLDQETNPSGDCIYDTLKNMGMSAIIWGLLMYMDGRRRNFPLAIFTERVMS